MSPRKILFLITLLITGNSLFAEERYQYGVGVGVGANFAYTLGANFSYRMDQIDLIGAVGFRDHYSIGALYHFRDETVRWQPRIGLLYGTNGDLRTEYSEGDLEDAGIKATYLGTTILLGSRLALGSSRRHGIEFDIAYKLTDGGYREASDSAFDELDTSGSKIAALGIFAYIFDLFRGEHNLQLSVGYRVKF